MNSQLTLALILIPIPAQMWPCGKIVIWKIKKEKKNLYLTLLQCWVFHFLFSRGLLHIYLSLCCLGSWTRTLGALSSECRWKQQQSRYSSSQHRTTTSKPYHDWQTDLFFSPI